MSAGRSEAGVNYFDVAPSYGNAELILGKSLRPYRKDVYLACKRPIARRSMRKKNFTSP